MTKRFTRITRTHKLTGFTILEFTSLLKLTVRTYLLELTGQIGFQTSKRCTGWLELAGCKGLLELMVRTSTGLTNLIELTGRTSVLELTESPGLSELIVYIVLLKLTELTDLKTSTEYTDFLELTGCADLRPSTVSIQLLEPTRRIDLQEVPEHIGSLKLKEHICSLGLTGDKGLQKLTGHASWLKFRYADNEIGNW